MFQKMFTKKKDGAVSARTIDKLSETLEMLEKKENFLAKRLLQRLKRPRRIPRQRKRMLLFNLRIHDQMIMLEGAKATTETVDALRSGAATMKAIHKATNIEDLDRTMDEVNEQTENMKQIQEALSMPIGAAADFDEDELEAELEELEGAELEDQLLEPTTSAPPAPVQTPAVKQPQKWLCREFPMMRIDSADNHDGRRNISTSFSSSIDRLRPQLFST
ncbi:hypothetical protein NL676_033859 [Syzygium grande]|nr:hypothetical protein NL676_033859 [Syzygium grande]